MKSKSLRSSLNEHADESRLGHVNEHTHERGKKKYLQRKQEEKDAIRDIKTFVQVQMPDTQSMDQEGPVL